MLFKAAQCQVNLRLIVLFVANFRDGCPVDELIVQSLLYVLSTLLTIDIAVDELDSAKTFEVDSIHQDRSKSLVYCLQQSSEPLRQ